MSQRGTWIVLAASIAALFSSGCGSGNEGGGDAIQFTRAAMTALPSVAAPGGANQAMRGMGGPATGTIADYGTLVYLFQLQCQHVPNDNYCPPTVTPTSGLDDPTRFTMGALIGMIYHAQMYAGGLVTSCSGDGFTPATVTGNSYHAGDAGNAAADPTRFVLDEYAQYTCRSSHVSNGSAETRVVSAVSDGSHQAALHTRYQYDAGDGRLQTDFFQVDVTMQGGAPSLLAFNFAAATPHASRIVLLANLTSHRFALKYYVPAQTGASTAWAVAAGVGGFDLSTGAANPGHYAVSFQDGSAPVTDLCVDNAGGVIQANDDPCTGDSVPMSWSSADTIAGYLGIAGADASRLAAFLAEFGTEAQLTASDGWQSASDETLYWPATLE